MGGFTVGYQITDEDTGITATSGYDNTSYGITFSVNDDLSIGYAHTESDGAGKTVDAEADSFQIAYTMGGATLKWAETDIANSGYSTATTAQVDGTTIALSLAF